MLPGLNKANAFKHANSAGSTPITLNRLSVSLRTRTSEVRSPFEMLFGSLSMENI